MQQANNIEEAQAHLAASPPFPAYRTLTYPDHVVMATYYRGEFVKVQGTTEEDCFRQLRDLDEQSTPSYSLQADCERTMKALPAIVVISLILVGIMAFTLKPWTKQVHTQDTAQLLSPYHDKTRTRFMRNISLPVAAIGPRCDGIGVTAEEEQSAHRDSVCFLVSPAEPFHMYPQRNLTPNAG